MSGLVLHGYQEEGKTAIEEKPGLAIFGDCGIGKTIICLSALSTLLTDFDIKGVLIVAPLRVARMTWPLEIQDWDEFSWMDYTLLHGPNKDERLKQDTPIYLINYEGLLWLEGKLRGINPKKWPFDMIIWDELTKMKNHSSNRFKLWKKFLKHFKRKVGLTGTPMANGYLDLWAQFFVVDQGQSLGTTFTGYKARFFYQEDFMGYNFKPRSGAEKIIQDLIAPNTLRISAEEHLDVPPLSFNDIELNLPKQARKYYDELEAELFTELDQGEELEAVNAAVLSNKCLQVASGAVYLEDEELGTGRYTKRIHDVKITAMKKLVKGIKKPVLVAYSFQHEKEILQESFPDAVVLKSGLSEERELEIQRDWNAGKIKMMICHPMSAGHGLNFQKGSNIGIWYSLNWSLELYIQFNARIHRQGQKLPVTFHRLIMLDTVEEVVSTTLERKDGKQKSMLRALSLYRKNKNN